MMKFIWLNLFLAPSEGRAKEEPQLAAAVLSVERKLPCN